MAYAGPSGGKNSTALQLDVSGCCHSPEQQVEMESVKEYVQQSSNVLALHSQIQSCDMILARMQEMLLGFQVSVYPHIHMHTRSPQSKPIPTTKIC